jgi:predicted branched-subunit amino acid permease
MSEADNSDAPVVFTTAGFRRGVRQMAPLILGIVPFGLVCGITGQGAGLSLAEITLMSTIVYAGASQLVALAVWAHPPDLLTVTFAALVVNLRLALMGPVLAPWLHRFRGWRVWLSLFLMADHNWALSVREMNAGYRDAAYLLGGGSAMFVTWVITTVAGHVLGAQLHLPPGHPLFFAALGAFVSILAQMWRGAADLLPWMVAAGVSILVAQVLPGTFWYIVAGALAGSIAGGVRDHRRRTRA